MGQSLRRTVRDEPCETRGDRDLEGFFSTVDAVYDRAYFVNSEKSARS
jgi:hypothetical protein